MGATGYRNWRVMQSYIDLLTPYIPIAMPFLFAPLAAGWWLQTAVPLWFEAHREGLLYAYLTYIVFVRFALLDMMLFYVSRKHKSIHLDLLQIVFLYLEITAVTLMFFALLFNLFGVFELFSYNGAADAQQLAAMQGHGLRLSLYISMEMFTTLGAGDWVPRTLTAMMAAGVESVLGFIQGGVFFAVLIYAHQGGKTGNR